MARDWETTFNGWTGPSSASEEAKRDQTEREIRSALVDYRPLANIDFKVYAKGSYKNNTNVKLDSDIDISVELTELFKFDRPKSDPDASMSDLGISPYTGDYSVGQFKDDVEAALVKAYGETAIRRENVAIKVRERRTTLPADVVPCVDHREFYFDSAHEPHYRQGTQIFPDKGSAFMNYPVQHYENGVAKNSRTGRRFKQMVRVLKRLENELVAQGKLEDEVPSYLMECLVYNVDDDVFGHTTYYAEMREVMAIIFNSTLAAEECKSWFEVNGIKYLFHSSQGWTREEAHRLIDVGWDYVGFE